MSLNKYMHPRNPYKYGKPDFKHLAEKYPEFSGHIVEDTAGKAFLDFKNPEALRVLTKTLLKEDFKLDVELPRDRLVPTIPLRLNYLLWIEDIVGKKKKGVRGIDIGTGASCVYPLLGVTTKKWQFLATDIDAQNIHFAKKNVEKNNLTNMITVKKVTEDALVTGALLDEKDDLNYDFCMCNPPFFADHMEAQAITTSRSVDRPEPTSVSTASPKECIAVGGEVAFVKQLITDSVALRTRVRVYTTMVGKKASLPPLKEELRRLEVPKYSTTEFCQGKTMRWGLAWSFDESVVFPKSPFQTSKNEKPPLTYVIPFGAGGSIYDIPSLTAHIKTILDDLKIQHKEKKCHKGYSSLSTVAYENTWSNQRRKRRQQQRLQKQSGGDNSAEKRDHSDSGENISSLEKKDENNSVSGKGDNPIPEKGDNSNEKGEYSSEKGDNSSKKGDNYEKNISSSKDDSGVADITETTDVEEKSESAPEKQFEPTAGDGPSSSCKDMEIEHGSGDRKRKAEEEECIDSKRLKTYDPDEVKGEEKSGSSKRRYVLKWEVNLKKPAGVREITLEMVWRDGERELMHQVMQYLKNKLKMP